MERFELLRQRVLRHQRICGIYSLHASAVPADAARERFLHNFAAPLGFTEPDVGPAEWKHAEASREDARQEVVQQLAGGSDIGHSRWDLGPTEAAAVADAFFGLFGDDATFYCSRPPTLGAQPLAPYARTDFQNFIFGGGCIAIDTHLAAVLWVLDND